LIWFGLVCLTLRLLTTLSMNAMPMALAQLIYNHTNDKKYFRATVTLKHSTPKYVFSSFALFLISLLGWTSQTAVNWDIAFKALRRMCWLRYYSTFSCEFSSHA
jgi:hypothetical protein